MSMMVNPVSNLSFRAQNSAVNSAEDLLNRPGAYSNPASGQTAPAAAQPAKNYKAAKIVLGALAAVAVVAGSLYAAHKFAPETFKAAREFKDIKNIEKTGEKVMAYITTTIGKGGKAVEDGAKYIANGCTNLWNKVFNTKATQAAEQVAQTVEQAAQATT